MVTHIFYTIPKTNGRLHIHVLLYVTLVYDFAIGYTHNPWRDAIWPQNGDIFGRVDALCPSQQLFSHGGMFF